MVEVIVNSFEDTLIDGLAFKLAKTASYITKHEGLHIFTCMVQTCVHLRMERVS